MCNRKVSHKMEKQDFSARALECKPPREETGYTCFRESLRYFLTSFERSIRAFVLYQMSSSAIRRLRQPQTSPVPRRPQFDPAHSSCSLCFFQEHSPREKTYFFKDGITLHIFLVGLRRAVVDESSGCCWSLPRVVSKYLQSLCQDIFTGLLHHLP